MGVIDKIKNVFVAFGDVQTPAPNDKNLNTSVVPIQIQRLRQDVLSWRLCVDEAERAYFPYRVLMQQLYVDTILNSQVYACMERRKDLTILRDWQIVNKAGTVDEKTTELLQKEWMTKLVSLSLDAIFFGYTLISLGDIINSEFPNVIPVKRQNISPDRLLVSPTTYSPSGDHFLDEPFKNWHLWVDTDNANSQTKCGYGLLYQVALYEIFLRNLLGYNGDFVELYSQPFRVGRTNKTEGAERDNFENGLKNLGSAGYAILDDIGDDIQFLETSLGGTGYQGYADFEKRLEAKISKVILGHADAIDSTPGKLGAGGKEDDPVYKAMQDKKTRDGIFVENTINTELFPRLRALGFNIPEDARFKFSNDEEQYSNSKRIIELGVELKKAGLQLSKEYVESITDLKLDDVVVPAPMTPSDKVQNRLKTLYGKTGV